MRITTAVLTIVDANATASSGPLRLPLLERSTIWMAAAALMILL
jgi:hypothetical protein